MADSQQLCPQCGTPGEGRFCSACGASIAGTASECGRCQATLSPGARHCHRCGLAVGQPVTGGSRTPWIVAGTVVVGLVAAIGIRAGGGITLVTPDMANSGNQGSGASAARPPDISQMTPRERFDRLFARVMEAGGRQDSAMVMDFTPMALGAYGQLEVFDQQARYQAALIRLQVGEFLGATALADTILAETPHHLLGLIISGTAARFQGDADGLEAAYREFLEHYDTQLAAGHPEYQAEQTMIESFRDAAMAGTIE